MKCTKLQNPLNCLSLFFALLILIRIFIFVSLKTLNSFQTISWPQNKNLYVICWSHLLQHRFLFEILIPVWYATWPSHSKSMKSFMNEFFFFSAWLNFYFSNRYHYTVVFEYPDVGRDRHWLRYLYVFFFFNFAHEMLRSIMSQRAL